MPEPITEVEKKPVQIPSAVVIKDLAVLLALPVTKVIGELIKNGVMSSMNERIDYDTAAIIAEDLGFAPEQKVDDESAALRTTEQELTEHLKGDVAAHQIVRPPVVVVMGHVDHGKTKLLDAIRETDVVSGESGGITQHIGAYQVEKKGRLITFIDTPGHEAFTAMRSRGAQVADIAILVVAADDGIKPQTKEAIKIIQQAKLPFLVAVNKMDKPEANIERVKQQLAEENLLTEDWGGKVTIVPVSATTKSGIDDLLETVLLVADIDPDHLKADPTREPVGSVVEARIDKGEGPVATVLVRTGTLKRGDFVKIGGIVGKVKALKDWRGHEIESAGPSVPAKMLGLKVAPTVGDVLVGVTADAAKQLRRDYKPATDRSNTQNVFQKKTDEPTGDASSTDKQMLNVILRCDNLGSQEAILESIAKYDNPYVSVNIVAKGLGSITDADVLRADTARALLIGFHVVPSPRADDVARSKQVSIQTYTVIYDLLGDIRKGMEALLPVERTETILGHVRILAQFRKEKRGMVIGGRVVDGVAKKGASVRVQRDGALITEGIITQLQKDKTASEEVKSGSECGMRFDGDPIIEVNDVLEFFLVEEHKRTLTV